MGGLVAFVALLPVVFVLLVVPQLVGAYLLGGLSAIAVRKGYVLVRSAVRNRSRRGRGTAAGRAQSR
jgi:hypothetical protein